MIQNWYSNGGQGLIQLQNINSTLELELEVNLTPTQTQTGS